MPAFVSLARRERRRLDRVALARLVVLGCIWGPGVMGFYAIATERTALAHVVFLVGLTPAVASLLAVLFYGGSIDEPRRFSLLLGTLGALAFALGRSGSHATLAGDLFKLAWVFAFGLYAAVAIAALRTLSPLFVTAGANVIGGSLVATASLFVPAWREAISAVAMKPHLALPFFGEIVVLGGLCAPLAYAFALERAPVSVVTGGAQYTSIAVGTIAAIALFREPFGPTTVAAGLLLAASLGVSLVPGRAGRSANAARSAGTTRSVSAARKRWRARMENQDV
ncbi:MAG: hypothetical protein NVSMB21_22640 [Vulcanimicrobiaceae bacterium]